MPVSVFKRSNSTPSVIMGAPRKHESQVVSELVNAHDGVFIPVPELKLMPFHNAQKGLRKRENVPKGFLPTNDNTDRETVYKISENTEKLNRESQSRSGTPSRNSAKKINSSEIPPISSPVLKDDGSISPRSTRPGTPNNENVSRPASVKKVKKQEKQYTYRDILKHLLQAWEQQLCDNHRPHVEYSAERDYLYQPNKPPPPPPKTPPASRMKAAETAIEIVNRFQRGHSAPVSRNSKMF